MTPEQKIQLAIITQAINDGAVECSEPITAENVDRIYQELNEDYELQDYENEFRSGEVETGIKCEYSRHYEAKSVAAKMPDGSWLGWTYWYGGGKHGEPEAIDWMSYAYELDCKEEEKMVVVRTFSKKD